MKLKSILKTIILIINLTLISNCSSINSQIRKVATEENSDDMEYVTVCEKATNCKKFSRLIMGTDHLIQANWMNNGQPENNENQIKEVLDESVRLGINVFDSSPIYVGSVEYKLGRYLQAKNSEISEENFYQNKSLNPDKKLYALSKGGFPFDLFYSGKLSAGTHSESFKKELKAKGILVTDENGNISLKDVPAGTYASRLFGDKEQILNRVSEELGYSHSNLVGNVTIYLMHRDDNDYLAFNKVPRDQTPVKTIMESLSSEKLTDHYSILGWSNWETDRVNQSLKIAAENPNLKKPMFNSAYFSLFEMNPERSIHAGGIQVTHKDMIDEHFQEGIFQNPYSPLGGFSIFDKPEIVCNEPQVYCNPISKWENAEKAAIEKVNNKDAYWKNVKDAIFTEANKARYVRVVEFTAKFNKDHNSNYTIDQIINAYALAHKRTNFLTIGPITVEQLRRTVASLKLSRLLSPSDLDYLHHGN